jgi:D-serine deaminase-like pyridoxal phosphate-dependent protein
VDVNSIHKGLWSDSVIGASLFAGAVTWPMLVLRRSAVEHNIATMADYCARHGVLIAPHGKTTMAPRLFQAQLDAGAWGITVATGSQARVARAAGVPRVVLANEVLDPAVLRWAADEVAAGWDFTFYVDSPAGVSLVRSVPGAFGVLIEMGYPGGRTGCRDLAAVARLAAELSTVDGVRLVGVAGFEGMLTSIGEVRAFLEQMLAAAEVVTPYCDSPLLLSAGGSRFFDVVVDVFAGPARERGWPVLLRSGCYLTHDHGFYADDSPFVRDPSQGVLQPALEVWTQVLSAPEPGLALLNAGKRDVPSDLGLPTALEVRGLDGSFRDLSTVEVVALNDQHAYLLGASVAPGELVRLGISHPCTAFDRWRMVPMVDDEHRIVELLPTYF